MKYWALLLANLRRNPTRNVLTAASFAIAFVLFGLLRPIALVFSDDSATPTAGRLIVVPKHSTSDLLPISHLAKIAAVRDVTVVSPLSWFGGTYQDSSSQFAQYAVDPEAYLRVMREIQLEPEQQKAFFATRTGAIIGRESAQQFNIQPGDKVSIFPNIWSNREGRPWTFDVVGVFDSSNPSIADPKALLFAQNYFDEYRAFANGYVLSFVVGTSSPEATVGVAKAIDGLFENSDAETITYTDQQYALSFAKQIGKVGLIVNAVLAAVMFTLLLLTANTFAQSLRERVRDVAVMRAIGFQASTLLLILLAEPVALALVSSLVGMLMASVLLSNISTFIPALSQLGPFPLTTDVVVSGLLLASGIGLVVAIVPASRALLLKIVDALRI